jgi:hypothetical protein
MTTRVADPNADELPWPDGVEVEALLKTVLADAHESPLDPDDDELEGAAALAGGVDAADGNGVSGTAIAAGRPPACSAPALASSSGTGSGTAACADGAIAGSGGCAGPVILAASASASASW